jgi:tRNA threonylcarbamoyladenosine biosynthesis protein TsaB
MPLRIRLRAGETDEEVMSELFACVGNSGFLGPEGAIILRLQRMFFNWNVSTLVASEVYWIRTTMLVFAVDTCTEEGSIALARDGKLLSSVALPPGWRSTSLHGEIAALLARHGVETRDIDLYAVSSGPGSFTGVRLGLAAVKGMAEIHAKPVVPVSTLETIATAAACSCSIPPTLFAALFDARRGQVFGALYRNDSGGLQSVSKETVSSLATFLDSVRSALPPGTGSNGNLAFCGIDLDPYIQEIAKAGWQGAPMLAVPRALAGTLTQIAERKVAAHGGANSTILDALTADANYVRVSDAELFWKG